MCVYSEVWLFAVNTCQTKILSIGVKERLKLSHVHGYHITTNENSDNWLRLL